jgi:hypothetical protein
MKASSRSNNEDEKEERFYAAGPELPFQCRRDSQARVIEPPTSGVLSKLKTFSVIVTP